MTLNELADNVPSNLIGTPFHSYVMKWRDYIVSQPLTIEAIAKYAKVSMDHPELKKINILFNGKISYYWEGTPWVIDPKNYDDFSNFIATMIYE